MKILPVLVLALLAFRAAAETPEDLRRLREEVRRFDPAAACIQTRRPYRPEQNYPLHAERFADDWFTLNFTGRTNCNPWGLYDMHGNAAEWTRTTTPDGRAVVRGGSFASRPKDATSSFRLVYWPWQKVFDVGFRVRLDDARGSRRPPVAVVTGQALLTI